MEKGTPVKNAEVECPVLKQKREVDFEVNIFRGSDHGGMHVRTCSEFLQESGTPTCGEDCVHGDKARALHEAEMQKHLDELAKIGRNVIG